MSADPNPRSGRSAVLSDVARSSAARTRLPAVLLLVAALFAGILWQGGVDAAPAAAATAKHHVAKHPPKHKAPALHTVKLKRPARTVASVTPSAGPLAGDTRVVIRGTGFTPASVVKFGATRAVQLSYRSPTALIAYSPIAVAGAAKITVTTAGHVHSVWRGGATRIVKYRGSKRPVQAAAAFTFQSPPALASVSAQTLVPGARITLTGTALSRASAVLFGTVKGTKLTVVSSSRLTVTVPDAAYGQTTVSVVTPGGATGKSLIPGGNAGVNDAIYDWWSGPTAVEDGTFTWLTSISSTGVIQLTRYNNTSGVYKTIALGRVAPDEHSTPAVLFSPDQGSVLVFWTGHISYTYLSYRAVDRSTLAVGATQRLDFSAGVTYVQFLQHDNTVSVVTRVGGTAWGIRTSTDFGASWSAEGELLQFPVVQSYALLRPGAVAGHYLLTFYGNPKSIDHTIVAADIDTTTGAIRGADGAIIGDLFAPGGPAIDPSQMEVVYQPAAGTNVRLLDVGVLGGHPAVLYADWGMSDNAASYHVATRTGGVWTVASWALPAGSPVGFDPEVNYVGGASFDGDGDVYTSREVAGHWYVEKWRWDGVNLGPGAPGALMTSTSALMRPTVAIGSNGTDLFVAEADRYDGYEKYHATIVRVPQL